MKNHQSYQLSENQQNTYLDRILYYIVVCIKINVVLVFKIEQLYLCLTSFWEKAKIKNFS